jgi:F420H(2)-dependent quinone reductase
MPLDGTYEPSPWDIVANQVADYERTGGEVGGEINGAPCIVLWTRGRKTGVVRKTPLVRVEDNGRYAVLASMGGADTNPVWYLNLKADGQVSLQDGPEVKDYVAHEATGAERDEWWGRATEVWPDYDNYQAKTDRVIPVFVLEPVG